MAGEELRISRAMEYYKKGEMYAQRGTADGMNEAIMFYMSAIDVLREGGSLFDNDKISSIAALIYHERGLAYTALNEYNNAIRDFEEALKYANSANDNVISNCARTNIEQVKQRRGY